MEAMTITVDGKTYELAYDFNALVKAEELSGLNLLTPRSDSASYRALLLSVLLPKHPEMTLEGAGALIRAGNLEEISNAMGRCRNGE